MLPLDILVALLLLAGLIGTLIPALPGPALILVGALVHALAHDFDPIGPGRLLVLAALAGFAYLVDYLAGAAGARRFGGSGWAVAGAIAGALVGLFFSIPGLLIGPIVGAVAAEWLHSRDARVSLKTGVGTAVGLLAGLAVKLGAAVAMIALFLFWLWRG